MTQKRLSRSTVTYLRIQASTVLVLSAVAVPASIVAEALDGLIFSLALLITFPLHLRWLMTYEPQPDRPIWKRRH